MEFTQVRGVISSFYKSVYLDLTNNSY